MEVRLAIQPPNSAAGDQRDALGEPDPADALLERVAVPGFLQHGVVDDGVQCSRVHREEDAEDQGAEDVGGDVGAESADQRAQRQGDAGHDQDAAPAPPVGEDARGHLDDRARRRRRRRPSRRPPPASKPISLMNSFSTGTQSMKPCKADREVQGSAVAAAAGTGTWRVVARGVVAGWS